MKSKVFKILIAFTAVVFTLTMQFSVCAGALNILEDNVNTDIIQDWIDKIINGETTTAETTTAQNDETTTATGNENTTQDPVNSSGTGSLTTTTEPTTQGSQNNYYPNYNYNPYPNYNNTTPTTTEPAGDEFESFTYESSLNQLLESDSAAIIVQNPSESYTIGGLIVNDGNDNDGFTWQKAALIAVAVLFVVLAALVAALLIQRSKKPEQVYVDTSRDSDDSEIPDGPVSVEIMTQERIAELLGTAQGKGARYTVADSASAIKTAALMGQLDSYSDPLLRKYTDEPVRFSPVASIDPDGDVTAAQILEATASMLDDITGNEKYASDTSGMGIADEELDSILNDTEIKNCPECQSPIKSGDMFCHSCGAFVGE